MKRIVIACDFSPMSKRALGFVAELHARESEPWVVDVVHALDVRGQLQEDTEASDAADQHARARLVALFTPFAQRGLHFDATLLHGPAWIRVVQHAEATAADLLVVGARAHGGLRESLLGRTAEHIIRYYQRPTLLLQRKGEDTQLPKVVACALALDGHQDAVLLTRAKALATHTGAKFKLIHIIEQGIPPSLFRTQIAHGWKIAAEDARASLVNLAAKEHVEVDGGIEVASGHLVNELPKTLSSARVDLLVVGSRGGSVFERALLGSFAQTALTHSDCDLLVLNR